MSKVTLIMGKVTKEFDSEDLPQDGQRMVSKMEKDMYEEMIPACRALVMGSFLDDLILNSIKTSFKHWLATGKRPMYITGQTSVTHDLEAHKIAHESYDYIPTIRRALWGAKLDNKDEFPLEL